MSDAPFLADLLHEYADGAHTRRELYTEILARLDAANVDRAIAALPDELRGDFVGWARRRYDNQLDPGHFLFVAGPDRDVPPEEALAALRAWFARHR